MDKDIKEHWNFYITQNVIDYMDKRYKTDKNISESVEK